MYGRICLILSQKITNKLLNNTYIDRVATPHTLIGLPHPDQSKIPSVFNIFPVFFQPQNVTSILIPQPIERYATINTQFQMLQRLLQKLHSITGLSPTQKFLQSQKIVAVSHHNPGISLNF